MNDRFTIATLLACFAVTACKQSSPIPEPDVATPTVTVTSEDTVVSPPDAAAPTIDDTQPLPLWPAVTRGTLPNGLTYYIMKHEKPAKRVAMWLAVNAGSVLEDEDQRGLAHFAEHMAFNGTTHFARSAIVDYLETIGMRFGADLNAYTSYDETVYQLLVPTDDAAYVDKGLAILRDWASEVSFDPVEVDKERGVVLEEWRLSRGAGERLRKRQNPVLFAGSRYAEREPIGLPEVIKDAPRDALVRFYRDWYRPDLMAVIVVGDIDPAAIKADIVKRFGDLKNPDGARPRARAELPTSGTRVSIETDPELTETSITVYDLVSHRPESTGNDLRRNMVEQLQSTALDARYDVLARRPDAPFLRAGAGAESLMREIDTFARAAVVKGDRIEDALRSLFTEVLRVERHGFSAAELERARKNVTRMYDQYAADESSADGSEYTAEMTRNFFEGELMIGRIAETAAARRFLPELTLDELNGVAKAYTADGKNRVIVIDGREGVGLPSRERVLQIIAEVEQSEIAPWEDGGPTRPLMTTPPAAGTVTATKTIEAIGVTEWTLSNGLTVLVKPTDFEADHVSLSGSGPGGLNMAPDDERIGARLAESMIAVGGVGDLDATALEHALAGKSASAGTFIDGTREGIGASCRTADLETMFQLAYLRITAPRRDDTAISVWREGLIDSIANGEKSPAVRYERELTDFMFSGHPATRSLVKADVEAADIERALAFHRERFGDLAGTTFAIVGAVDLETLRPLVETYLASLPTKGPAEPERDSGARLVAGDIVKTWHLGQEPKASVRLTFHGEDTWSRDAERDLFILTEVLNLRLHQVLREDLGGVYGVGASGALSRRPRQERVLTISFGCAPDNVDKLVAAALDVGQAIAAKGPTAEELEKVRQKYLRGRETDLRENGFWLSWLMLNARFGDDPTRILDPSGVLARIAPEHVQAAATRFMARARPTKPDGEPDAGGLFQAVLMPATP